jgi:excisionase family DNA binding protein
MGASMARWVLNPREKLAELAGIVRLLTVSEAAQALSLSERSTRALIAEGSLPVVRVGVRGIRIHPDDLRGFIEERRQRRGA